jgi:hypothetical protein
VFLPGVGALRCPVPRLIARECYCCRYKGKSVHVIFFGDDTEAWCDIKKIKSPFAEHLGEHGKKSGGVAAAVEQAQTWISEAGVANAGGDEVDAKSSSDDDDDDVGVEDGDDTAHAAAATAAATGDEEQAATGRATVEADSESGEAAASTASADGAKQVEQLGDGGGASAGTGGDEGEGEGEDEGDQDDADDDDVDDDDDNDSDSELSLDDDSEDDGPAFEPKQRKSAKPAAKRKASARGAPSAKRSRSDGGPARRAPNENAHDAPVSETELRDAPVTELISLRAQADDGMSEFAKARTLVDSIHASRLKLQAKLDKVKKQEKQATKLQQDAKANIRMALKEVAGCKMTVSALKETSWGKTVKKLSKFEGDANISKVADAQLSRWKATVSVETDASVVSAETKQEEPQSADQGSPTPKPAAGPAADETIQPEPRQQRESTDSQGDGQRTESTVAPQEQAHSAAAPSGDAEAEAAASEKLRAKVSCRDYLLLTH